MRITKSLNLLSLCFGIGCAIHTANAGTTNTFGDWALLPAETSATNWGFPKGLEPLWNPPTNLVAEAIQRLPAFLEAAQTNGVSSYTNQLSAIRERLPITGCQAIGVTLENRKGILLNCFPLARGSSGDWKKRFIKVYDGGPGWWSVVYLPEDEQFARLRVDLGF